MNRIKTYLNGLGRGTRTIVIALAAVFVSAGIAQAATTISTNISTGGTLGVTGLSSLNFASSTLFSANVAYFGQSATSTFDSAGNLAVIGTLGVTGNTTLASTTATSFKVGQTGTQYTGLVAGYCNIASVGVTSTSTAFAICSSATGVAVSDRVFVQATSSMPSGLIVVAASSTVANTISVQIYNGAASSTPSILSTGAISLNFWAFR